MERIILLLALLIIFTRANAQADSSVLDITSYTDHLDRSALSTGFLYDRVLPLSNIQDFTGL